MGTSTGVKVVGAGIESCGSWGCWAPSARSVGSGHGPKGTEGDQATPSQDFISGDHTALTNLSRNTQALRVHCFKNNVDLQMQMRCSPPAPGNLPRQPLLLPPVTARVWWESPQSSHSSRGGEFLCLSCIKMALHAAVLPRAKGFCSHHLLGSFSSLLSRCRNWIYRIKTIG